MDTARRARPCRNVTPYLERRDGTTSRAMRAAARTVDAQAQKESTMIKFLGKTAGIIFLIGLAVVIGLLMLIF